MIINSEKKIEKYRSDNPFIGSRELAYRIILDSILSGELNSDIRLTQSTLADELDMSRTPVKEALSMLERDGFLEKEENSSGFTVKRFDISDFIDFSEMRLALEPEAAFHAARYISESGIKRLEGCLKTQERLASQKDMAGLVYNHTQFHKIIAEESQNRYFCEIYRIYENKSLFFNQGIMSENNISYNLIKHRLIADRIIHHCESEAREEMRIHLSFYAKSAARKML